MSDVIPESRSYIHVKCGQATELTDSEFKVVSKPLPGTRMTMCAACCQYFPIAEFKWEDTGEDLVAYYARLREKVPASFRLMCSSWFGYVLIAAGLLAGIAVGIATSSMFGLIWGVAIGIVAVLAGMLGGLFLWDWNSNRIVTRALGVPDVRCLK